MFCPMWRMEPRSSSSYPSRCTDWAIPPLISCMKLLILNISPGLSEYINFQTIPVKEHSQTWLMNLNCRGYGSSSVSSNRQHSYQEKKWKLSVVAEDVIFVSFSLYKRFHWLSFYRLAFKVYHSTESKSGKCSHAHDKNRLVPALSTAELVQYERKVSYTSAQTEKPTIGQSTEVGEKSRVSL
jgi:hypothetical protein